MRKLIITGSAIVVVLVIGFLIYQSSRPKKFAQPVPTSCPAPASAECPPHGGVDANGCPAGGYNSSTGECVVPFTFYKKYGGCREHDPMAFYTKASPGKPSKYHLVSDIVFHVQAAFTEIDCDSHVAVGAVNAGQPFLVNPNDNFSDFKHEHVSDDADPAMAGKCFKVTVNPAEVGDCIDPHIIVKNE
jgi:hypothetical protein